MQSRFIVGCVAGLLAIQASLLTYSARVHSPTWDEVGHLAAGISHWEFGRFELYSVNPPLLRTIAAAPVVAWFEPKMDWNFYRSDPAIRSEVFLGRRMMELNGEDSLDFFFAARLAVIPVALLGGLVCFLWSSELFGTGCGLLAQTLWTFSPNVLAYGSVITPDLASAVALLVCCYIFWRWMRDSSWGNGLALGVSMAVAVLVKSVWLLLPLLLAGLWFLALLYRRFAHRGSALARAEVQRQAGQLVAAGMAAILLVNVFYGFRGTLKPLGQFQFHSRVLAGPPECEDCGPAPGNLFESSLLAGVPVPLPENLVQGIDIQERDFERGFTEPAWRSYLFGEWKFGGWWYYYLVGLAVKVPIVFWVFAAASTIAGFAGKLCPDVKLAALCLWGPSLIFLVVVSMHTGMSRYVRYALPVLPALLVWGSGVGVLLSRQSKWANGFVAAGCLWLVVGVLGTGPHWLSYFNEFAGGTRGGSRLLCDSNIDWGQDLTYLKEWLDENPEAATDLRLAYFGSFDPKDIGIEYELPAPLYPQSEGSDATAQYFSGPRPGWYAISVNYVLGHLMPVPDGQGRFLFQSQPVFEYFSQFEPVARLGGSIFVYHLRDHEVNEFRVARGMVPIVSASDDGAVGMTSGGQQQMAMLLTELKDGDDGRQESAMHESLR
ncbi:ArnT family glycosyltransferase [Crateriforma conspicua]|uniref:ArnT family glycosyltransferase n=1 Tax=Crateriforma conspicua TaxID=2527996 RepID=UPI0018CFBEBD|nr:glycosyltransferase family 39 protein [Crateriforma conspicua]